MNRCHGSELTATGPGLTVIGAAIVEPMIVGPIAVATCPMLGPTNARAVPQIWLLVAPASPTPDGAFGPTQSAGALAWPPCATPSGQPIGGKAALALETGAAAASAAIAADSARSRLGLARGRL
jgi:hypothetical protein